MATSKGSTKTSKATKGSKAGATAARAKGGAVPPYGDPIREASARGDVQEMRKVAASARKWIKDVQSALEKLEGRIAKLGGGK
jgi:Domain of unknown function (DUF1843)